MSDDEISVKVNDSHPFKRKHVQHSNVLLTINTNQRVDIKSSEYPIMKQKFKEILNEIFNRNFKRYISFKRGAPTGSNFKKQWFKSIKLEFATEVGPKTKCLHAHILIKIAHYTLIKIDMEKIREDLDKLMKEKLNISSYHFHFDYTKRANDNIDNIRKYIYKNPE